MPTVVSSRASCLGGAPPTLPPSTRVYTTMLEGDERGPTPNETRQQWRCVNQFPLPTKMHISGRQTRRVPSSTPTWRRGVSKLHTPGHCDRRRSICEASVSHVTAVAKASRVGTETMFGTPSAGSLWQTQARHAEVQRQSSRSTDTRWRVTSSPPQIGGQLTGSAGHHQHRQDQRSAPSLVLASRPPPAA